MRPLCPPPRSAQTFRAQVVSANRISALIGVAALVAIGAILIGGGTIELPSIGGDDDAADTVDAPSAEAPAEEEPAAGDEPADDEPAGGTVAPNSDAHGEAHAREEEAAPDPPEVPDDPDEVHGSDSYALTRPANLRRALAVLERRRARVRGVFDGLRVAPGRLDTVIVHPDDRRTNIQVRADFEVAFESTHDFPTQADFRKGGLTARDVDASAPARLLRGIDRQRRGSAARDVDYIVFGKSIIDRSVHVTAYMRIRTLRPRYFRLEGRRVEAFG
jgi:hypothetical protein